MSNKIGGLRNTGMVQTDNIFNINRPFKLKGTIKTIKNDIIDSNSFTEEFIQQMLNSKEYQQKRIEEKEYTKQNKKFKTIKISPNISYNVFDKVKIVNMIPPIGMSIDDYE